MEAPEFRPATRRTTATLVRRCRLVPSLVRRLASANIRTTIDEIAKMMCFGFEDSLSVESRVGLHWVVGGRILYCEYEIISK